LLLDRFDDLPETGHHLVRMGAKLSRVLASAGVDEERLDDDHPGTARGASPVVGHMTR
jgi:hypothetical protein